MEVVTENKKNFVLSAVKGTLIAVCVSLVMILLLALILKFVSMSDGAIKTINQIIKVLSIFLGVFIALKKSSKRGLVKGTIIGLAYTIVAFLCFSLLGNKIDFNISLLFDCLFAILIGGICGAICINSKRRISVKL